MFFNQSTIRTYSGARVRGTAYDPQGRGYSGEYGYVTNIGSTVHVHWDDDRFVDSQITNLETLTIVSYSHPFNNVFMLEETYDFTNITFVLTEEEDGHWSGAFIPKSLDGHPLGAGFEGRNPFHYGAKTYGALKTFLNEEAHAFVDAIHSNPSGWQYLRIYRGWEAVQR